MANVVKKKKKKICIFKASTQGLPTQPVKVSPAWETSHEKLVGNPAMETVAGKVMYGWSSGCGLQRTNSWFFASAVGLFGICNIKYFALRCSWKKKERPRHRRMGVTGLMSAGDWNHSFGMNSSASLLQVISLDRTGTVMFQHIIWLRGSFQ